MKHCQTQSPAKRQSNLSFHQGSYWKCPFSNRGFTLIELLVVTIIVSILAAVSIPNLIAQIGKARETEAKNQLGTLSRSQEVFHFEKQIFASSLAELSLPGSINAKYYDYQEPLAITNLVQGVEHKASALPISQDSVRNYTAGVYFDSGLYVIIVCQSNEINGTVDAPNTHDGDCNGGTKLE